jgi:hypothetical protein
MGSNDPIEVVKLAKREAKSSKRSEGAKHFNGFIDAFERWRL